MRAIDATGKTYKAGDQVFVYKFDDASKRWLFTGETGVFEEIVYGKLINFNVAGKPRQCMPEGLGLILE